MLSSAPFLIYKVWLGDIMFRGKSEMRFSTSDKPDLKVLERRENDHVMFLSGEHNCKFRISKVHKGWSRPSQALRHFGWRRIAPRAHSEIDALESIWRTFDKKREFVSAHAWDQKLGQQHADVRVWEGRCTSGVFDKTHYTFDMHGNPQRTCTSYSIRASNIRLFCQHCRDERLRFQWTQRLRRQPQ
jgi:hypothetical protein